ncbi:MULTISPECIES: efflux transporter outer membrane subunit [unclassified Shinella]|jgi:multidrug efflux system outer membrane protein|uniref:efflux transporter outer membrane subunit n=1 Tax=unclassified Shinella TaxID=2643062 RepID=UPI0003C56C41|nr:MULTISPECIES: efflux transporter outer membrane subunit [unclassified Shinella]MCA0344021.1 efflux transporter outer membrane subunit [Pseudomonadota bacterium]EYR80855.1 nodulation protein T [Shinella sp. DD12]KNY16434.1 nodulation protein NodT [Shinella sp. SUS2]KOC77022.1 nodulation protein NodT [Shinella sp. GWS1]MCO5150800.1 efflux transporter outer membrane subunit [Shinella sp.]
MNFTRTLFPLSMLLLSGCVVGPDYQKPETALPAKFSESKATSGESVTLNPWWESFRDKRLNDLVHQGMAENLSVLQALERITAAEANVVVAGAGALPSIGASAEASASGQDGDYLRRTSGGYSSSSKSLTAGASASWLLDFFGQYRRSKEAANASLDAAYDDVNVARLAYLSDLVSSYVNARYYQEALALSRKNLESRRETLKLTNEIKEAGAASSLDVLQAEGLVNQTLAELPGLETGFHQSANHIATLLGLPASTITSSLIKGSAQPMPRYATRTGIPADLIRNRPDIRAAERRLEAATAQIGVAEADLYPSIELGGSIGATRNFTSAATGNLTSWSFGPTLTLPIFNGGSLKARVKIARSEAEQQYLTWKSTVLNAVEEVENAQAALIRDGQTVAAQRKVVNSYEQTLNLARESYRGGASTILDVLDAERNVATARLQLASAIRQLARDFVALNVAIGGGAEIGSATVASK